MTEPQMVRLIVACCVCHKPCMEFVGELVDQWDHCAAICRSCYLDPRVEITAPPELIERREGNSLLARAWGLSDD